MGLKPRRRSPGEPFHRPTRAVLAALLSLGLRTEVTRHPVIAAWYRLRRAGRDPSLPEERRSELRQGIKRRWTKNGPAEIEKGRAGHPTEHVYRLADALLLLALPALDADALAGLEALYGVEAAGAWIARDDIPRSTRRAGGVTVKADPAWAARYAHQ